MNWRVEFRPEIEKDVADAVAWYNRHEEGLGVEFVEEVIRVWDALSENPLVNSRRHPRKNIRWRFPERFPYRVIYEVDEAEHRVLVVALHAARNDSAWQSRIEP
jgi:toxin ParE1/3/4